MGNASRKVFQLWGRASKGRRKKIEGHQKLEKGSRVQDQTLRTENRIETGNPKTLKNGSPWEHAHRPETRREPLEKR